MHALPDIYTHIICKGECEQTNGGCIINNKYLSSQLELDAYFSATSVTDNCMVLVLIMGFIHNFLIQAYIYESKIAPNNGEYYLSSNVQPHSINYYILFTSKQQNDK